MVLTLLVTGVVMIILIAPTGMCSFEPGRPENGPVREVDAGTFLRMEAASLGVPVRDPGVPEGWTPNSARRGTAGGEEAAVTGYITADEGYLQLTQTGASERDAAATEGREKTGEREVGGATVSVYAADSGEVRDIWAIDLGETRALISGAAPESDWETLAEAVVEAPVIDQNPGAETGGDPGDGRNPGDGQAPAAANSEAGEGQP